MEFKKKKKIIFKKERKKINSNIVLLWEGDTLLTWLIENGLL